MGLGFIGKLFAGGVSEVANTVGKGVGSLMNRLGFTEKMSEQAKMDYTIKLIEATNETDKLDAADLKSAREMAMTHMQLCLGRGSYSEAICWMDSSCVPHRKDVGTVTVTVHQHSVVPNST